MGDYSLQRTQGWRFLVGAVAAIGALGIVRAEPLSGSALVGALQRGGCVLVMRHASSPEALPDKATADPENLGGERQLDEVGRSTVHAMGEALEALRIPIAHVLSSPTYRARETVRLAGLGTPEVVAELDVGGQRDMRAAANGTLSAWLRQTVAVRPPAGSNTLIVTHGPNILGAFGQSAANLSDGEILVFRPDGKGAADLLARIKIEDWPRLAVEDPSQKARR
jgi:phosphohistidine phosphatase SixA